MRKKYVLFLLMMVAAFPVGAQIIRGDMVQERTKLGIQGGLNLPWQTVGNDGYSDDVKAGVIGGLQLEIPLRYGWYLQPEVNFAQMGAKGYTDFDDGTTLRTTYDYQYLQVPVLVKYKPGLRGFGFYFGPQYGYLLSAKYKYPAGTRPDEDYRPISYKSELSLVLGAEYYFPSANDGPCFGFTFRWMSGLTNTINKDYFDGYTPSVNNQGLSIGVGVRF